MDRKHSSAKDAGVCSDPLVCPNDCDLLLLRDAAADERTAIAFYLNAALCTDLDELFLDIAEDEMQHFAETMRLISRYDPVQAERLRDEGLNFLVMARKAGNQKWTKPPCPQLPDQDIVISPPTKQEMPTVNYLTKAIVDELLAINKYQKYMCEAEHDSVKEHFCRLMNEEKEHVAELTAALFDITHEPLPEEDD